MNKRRFKKAVNKWLDGKQITVRERQALQKHPIYYAMGELLKAVEKAILYGTGEGEPTGLIYAELKEL